MTGWVVPVVCGILVVGGGVGMWLMQRWYSRRMQQIIDEFTNELHK